MDLDIEKVLYDVPEGQLFPMELSHHLRKKLNVGGRRNTGSGLMVDLT